MTYWRAVHADGADAGIDRLTSNTIGPLPALVVAPDSLGDLVTGGGPRWAATMAADGQTQIFGYYKGRPSPERLSALFADVLSGKAKPLAGFGGSGNSITITLPSH